MKLIDADKLIKDIVKMLQPARPDETEMYKADDIFWSVEKLIKEQPTAYDVDKVVEQLEEKRFKTNWFMANNINDTTRFSIESNRAFAYDTAIEIVKAGGIDGKEIRS